MLSLFDSSYGFAHSFGLTILIQFQSCEKQFEAYTKSTMYKENKFNVDLRALEN